VPSAGAAQHPAENHALRVLLAEDNEIGALLATRMLESAGCVIVRARDGAAAVEAWRKSMASPELAPFDLILMDMHMPVVDGLDATRTIKREAQALLTDTDMSIPPIIALTANAFAEDRRMCLEAGMDDYLAKPFEKADLLDIIDRWCGAGRTSRRHGLIAATHGA
jgi:CheY-like chemotaxis protein